MTRACARPGCNRPAVATLSYAYRERTVWIESLAPDAHPMTHDLCESHAGELRVPRGWDRRDLRVAVASERVPA